jgi:hypothetical protein
MGTGSTSERLTGFGSSGGVSVSTGLVVAELSSVVSSSAAAGALAAASVEDFCHKTPPPPLIDGKKATASLRAKESAPIQNKFLLYCEFFYRFGAPVGVGWY